MLGLDHGGLDDVDNKPNHFSVMETNTYADRAYARSRPLDYGRIDSTLDEAHLNEWVGIPKAGVNIAELSKWTVVWSRSSSDPASGCLIEHLEAPIAAIDWNGGGFDSVVIVDLGNRRLPARSARRF